LIKVPNPIPKDFAMKTIDLFYFKDSEYKDLYAWLQNQHETAFHIIMTRYYTLPDADKRKIADEYYNALFFGEKLSALSNDFGYYTPSEYSTSPFAFFLITNDMEQLADTLFYLIKGVAANDLFADTFCKYNKEKEVFWFKYYNEKIEPACKGILHILEKNI